MAPSASDSRYSYLDDVMSATLSEKMIINRVQQGGHLTSLFIQVREEACIIGVILAFC